MRIATYSYLNSLLLLLLLYSRPVDYLTSVEICDDANFCKMAILNDVKLDPQAHHQIQVILTENYLYLVVSKEITHCFKEYKK